MKNNTVNEQLVCHFVDWMDKEQELNITVKEKVGCSGFTLSKNKLSMSQFAKCTAQFCSYLDRIVQYKGWRIVTLTVCSLTK